MTRTSGVRHNTETYSLNCIPFAAAVCCSTASVTNAISIDLKLKLNLHLSGVSYRLDNGMLLTLMSSIVLPAEVPNVG